MGFRHSLLNSVGIGGNEVGVALKLKCCDFYYVEKCETRCEIGEGNLMNGAAEGKFSWSDKVSCLKY